MGLSASRNLSQAAKKKKKTGNVSEKSPQKKKKKKNSSCLCIMATNRSLNIKPRRRAGRTVTTERGVERAAAELSFGWATPSSCQTEGRLSSSRSQLCAPRPPPPPLSPPAPLLVLLHAVLLAPSSAAPEKPHCFSISSI